LVFASAWKPLKPVMCSRIHYKMQKPNQGSEKKRGMRNCERFLEDRPGDSAWISEC
jgi:hypothetical protein